MTGPRWRVRPDGANWGDYGAEDELGRLNELTPRRVLRGAAEIVTGETFALSLPLDCPGGRVLSRFRKPPCHAAILGDDGRARFNYPGSRSDAVTDLESDDLVTLHTHYSTHWDALCHVGGFFDADGDGTPEPVYYNGYRAGLDVVAPEDRRSASRLGLDRAAAAGLVGRAVMVDLAVHLGDREGPLAVDFATLARILEADGIEVEPGDILCLRTGYAEQLSAMRGSPDLAALESRAIGLDGRDPALLDWIGASGIVAIAADNFAVETWPARPPTRFPASELPLHEHCLFKLGILLGELWHFGPLAAGLRKARRNHFFLSATPLRLPGAAGSPLTPVGIL